MSSRILLKERRQEPGMHVSAVCGRQVPIEVLLQCGNPREQASQTGSIQSASRQLVDDAAA